MKASFTIELSLLMPLILLVFFAVFYLNFFFCGRALCKLSACEQAVTGHALEEITPFYFAPLERTVDDSEPRRAVRIAAQMHAPFLRRSFYVDIDACYEKTRPCKVLRRAKALQDLFS